MLKWKTSIAVMLAAILGFSGTTEARDYEVIDIIPGQSKDVYFEINLKGRVYIRIVGPPGAEACATFWWIKWPLGNIKDLGRHCGSATFEIPGWLDLAVSSKLRVGSANSPLKIVASENASIANSVTVSLP